MGEIGHSCPLNWAPKISALKWTLKKHPETNGKARKDKGRSVPTWAPKTTAPSLTNFYPSTKPSFYQSLHLSTECFTHLPSFHLFDSASSYWLISDIASACMLAYFSHVRLFAIPWTVLKFAQVHVYCVVDAIQPSHPLTPSSPYALNLSQHQGLFQ